MTTRSDELEDFKTLINLSEFAAAEGFEIDRKSSGRNSVAMKHANGDKIIIAMDGPKWVYFNVHDERDNGTILDFVMNRKKINLGEARKLLRPWVGSSASHPLPRPTATQFVSRLEPVPLDLVGVRARLAAMKPIPLDHAYLVGQRCIPTPLLTSDHLLDRVLVDNRSNAVFPHWNHYGLCGFEVKNAGFSGFAPGGVKGLWGSRKKEGDTHLVIAESAIDALSYAALENTSGMRLVSTAGQMNPDQPALLHSAMDGMEPGSKIIAAVDHDDGGDKLAEQIKGVFEALRRSDIAFRRHSPENPGSDWNDVQRASMGRETPSPGPV